MQVTLEVIARSRSAGVMQNELPKMFGKQPTNFSYTLKKLLALELIVRSPVKLRVSKASSATLSTALLRHVAFSRCKFEAHDQVLQIIVALALRNSKLLAAHTVTIYVHMHC